MIEEGGASKQWTVARAAYSRRKRPERLAGEHPVGANGGGAVRNEEEGRIG